MLVSVDVYRPAAREQLKIVADAIKANIYVGDLKGEPAGTALVERLAKEARREAVNYGCDVLIVDTAGRLHIDEDLMEEMRRLKALLSPQEILFVADAMTGQDAVRSAESFHRQLALTGTILTKMDGDARGGAALSIRHITGQPVKFIGTGEKPDAFEPFHPDRIVSRILGMGDIMTLIEKAESTLDRKKSEEFAARRCRGWIFAGRLSRSVAADQETGLDAKHHEDAAIGRAVPGTAAGGRPGRREPILRVEAIINSMTKKERNHHEIISGSRRKRIATGSGTSVQEVNQLLRQYAQMRKMFKSAGKPGMQRKLMGSLHAMRGMGGMGGGMGR